MYEIRKNIKEINGSKFYTYETDVIDPYGGGYNLEVEAGTDSKPELQFNRPVTYIRLENKARNVNGNNMSITPIGDNGVEIVIVGYYKFIGMIRALKFIIKTLKHAYKGKNY